MRRTSRRSPRISFPGFIGPRLRRGPRRGARPAVNRLEDRTLLATVTWINSAGGDWDTPSNWSTGTLPGPSDDAVIAVSGITVTHASSASDSVSSLTIPASDAILAISNGSLSIASSSSISGNLSISGGTLNVSASLTVGGATTWSSGTITGSGAVTCAGALTLLGDGDPIHPAIEDLDGATLDNAGAASATYGSLLYLSDGGVFDNRPGASFTVEVYPFSGEFGPITSDGSQTAFINEGTFIDDANDTLDISVPFDQTATGATQVQAGFLSLLDGGSISGPVAVDASATSTSRGRSNSARFRRSPARVRWRSAGISSRIPR